MAQCWSLNYIVPQYCTRVIAMQPLMVEPTGFTPKRNMLKTFLLGALALVGVVCLFQSGAAAGREVKGFNAQQ